MQHEWESLISIQNFVKKKSWRKEIIGRTLTGKDNIEKDLEARECGIAK
jgi:hypothetical protein